MVQIECLRQIITSGSEDYPVYVGFVTAEAISRVAAAPSFSETTANESIAKDVSGMPVKEWQRPLDRSRIDGIKGVFDDTGGLMPNPVLLAKNAFKTDGITISPKDVDGAPAFRTGTYIVEVAVPGANEEPSLWILDGQHRIRGLSESKQKNNMVPVVLLLDDGSGSHPYTPALLANLFAQVTTEATKLDRQHNEWLTYAFSLRQYAASTNGYAARRDAFETVVELCRNQRLSGSQNPFWSAVQFNDKLDPPTKPTFGGFSFSCVEFAQIIKEDYYDQPIKPSAAGSSGASRLDPSAVAGQLALAYSGLYKVIKGHGESVFFGSSQYQQRIVQKAFLSAVLRRLLVAAPLTEYETLLRGTGFDVADWNLSWARGNLNGSGNSASRSIASEVLRRALVSGKPPTSGTLSDQLRGNKASFKVILSQLTPRGRASKKNQVIQVYSRGDAASVPLGTHLHVVIGEPEANVGKIEIFSRNLVGGKQVEYSGFAKRGLDMSNYSLPLEIVVVMHHYGGTTSSAELTLTS